MRINMTTAKYLKHETQMSLQNSDNLSRLTASVDYRINITHILL